MNGLGELVFLILPYFLLINALGFFIGTFIVKKKIKILTMLFCVGFIFLFFKFKSFEKDSYIIDQQRQVGVYYLTQYPNCNNCFVTLKENMTYEIIKDKKVVEAGKWHHVIGGDYSITYLGDGGRQLGSGDYEYEKYVLKYQ